MADQTTSTSTPELVVLIRYADNVLRLEGMGDGGIGIG